MILNNIAIRTKSPELVEFFYPNYFKTSDYSPFIENGVIFSGDSKYLQSFRDAGIPYIYTKGTPEYDLTIPENLANFVYAKWDKKPTAKVLEIFKSKDKVTTEMEEIAKQVWVTGRCVLDDEILERLKGLYSLLARGSSYDIIDKFLGISSDMDTDALFYQIQGFLKSCNDVEGIRSISTQRNVKSFVATRGVNIDDSLMNYLYSPADNIEVKLIKLLVTLTVAKR